MPPRHHRSPFGRGAAVEARPDDEGTRPILAAGAAHRDDGRMLVAAAPTSPAIEGRAHAPGWRRHRPAIDVTAPLKVTITPLSRAVSRSSSSVDSAAVLACEREYFFLGGRLVAPGGRASATDVLGERLPSPGDRSRGRFLCGDVILAGTCGVGRGESSRRSGDARLSGVGPAGPVARSQHAGRVTATSVGYAPDGQARRRAAPRLLLAEAGRRAREGRSVRQDPAGRGRGGASAGRRQTGWGPTRSVGRAPVRRREWESRRGRRRPRLVAASLDAQRRGVWSWSSATQLRRNTWRSWARRVAWGRLFRPPTRRCNRRETRRRHDGRLVAPDNDAWAAPIPAYGD